MRIEDTAGYDYARKVVDKKIPACKWVRLACEKHLAELQKCFIETQPYSQISAPEVFRSPAWTKNAQRLFFRNHKAEHFLRFCLICRHVEGDKAGKRFEPEPWQVFFFACIFGWYKRRDEDGEIVRRFNEVYFEVARKNGKSFMACIIMIYCFLADGEQGAKCYFAATKSKQAYLPFKVCRSIILKSPALRKRIDVLKYNISRDSTNSSIDYLGQDSESLDGLNIHVANVDELHAHPNPDIYGVLDTATGARRNPFILATTTAGTDLQTICGIKRTYAEAVLDPKDEFDDISFFGLIYTLDKADIKKERHLDVENFQTWDRTSRKANPNLGVARTYEDLKKKVKLANVSPAERPNVERKYFNVWRSSVSSMFPMAKWDECNAPFSESQFYGQVAFGGLDLSTTIDTTGFALWLPYTKPFPAVITRCWIPEDNLEARMRKDRAPYEAWIEQGYISTTPGDVIDYEYIEKEIVQLSGKFRIQKIGFDRFNSSQTIQRLIKYHGYGPFVDKEGNKQHRMIGFGQGYASMNAPAKQLLRLIIGTAFLHGNNPVLRWMAQHTAATTNAAGDIKPDKEKSNSRIDLITSVLMALALSMLEAGEQRQQPIASIKPLKTRRKRTSRELFA